MKIYLFQSNYIMFSFNFPVFHKSFAQKIQLNNFNNYEICQNLLNQKNNSYSKVFGFLKIMFINTSHYKNK